MNIDPSGNFLISIFGAIVVGVIVAAVIVATVKDIEKISNEEVYVDKKNINSTNIQIENSNEIVTPWVQYGYSFYLNHINKDTKDIIKGSTAGVQHEWTLHNVAYMIFGTENAKHVDIGKTIFSDNHDKGIYKYMSIGMKGSHMSNGLLIWLIDLIMEESE